MAPQRQAAAVQAAVAVAVQKMAEGDEPPRWVTTTQETLGTLIKRPKLTEALLN